MIDMPAQHRLLNNRSVPNAWPMQKHHLAHAMTNTVSLSLFTPPRAAAGSKCGFANRRPLISFKLPLRPSSLLRAGRKYCLPLFPNPFPFPHPSVTSQTVDFSKRTQQRRTPFNPITPFKLQLYHTLSQLILTIISSQHVGFWR